MIAFVDARTYLNGNCECVKRNATHPAREDIHGNGYPSLAGLVVFTVRNVGKKLLPMK
jgi:hypothetical protein